MKKFYLLLVACFSCYLLNAGTITVSVSSLTVTGYNQGFGPTTAVTFTVSATGLTNNLLLTLPSSPHFQLSTDNATWAAGISLPQTGGNVGPITIYVRFIAGYNAGNYGPETLTAQSSGSGTTSQTVALSGTIYQPNNDCSGAIALTVNSASGCTTSTTGNTQYTTQSTAATCGGTADDDVWYSFVATSTSHIVTVNSTSSPAIATPILQVYSGSCASLTSLSCVTGSSTTATSTVSGLTIGATYYARVYSSANGSGQGFFTICVTTPAILAVSPSTLAFGNVCQGTASSEMSFTITGSLLSNNVTVTLSGTGSSSYTMGTVSGGPYSSGPLTVTQSSGSVNQTIYVIFTPASSTALSATITVASSPATSQTVTLSGTGLAVPGTVTISPATTTDCYGSLSSYTATASNASGSISTIHGAFENADSTAWVKGNTSSGSTQPDSSSWYTHIPTYTYSKLFSFFNGFFKFTYDWTFTGFPTTSRFFLSNSLAQNGGTTATTLTTKTAFSTVGYTSITVNFYQNLKVRSGDSAMVQLSTDGTNFTTIQKFTSRQGTETFNGTSGSFFGGNLHIKYTEGMSASTVTIPSSWLGLGSVYLRFKYAATSGASGGFRSNGNWWGIDSVTLTGSGGTAPTWAWTESPTSPSSLYQDAAYQNHYTGQNLATVYGVLYAAKTYTATATIGGTCPSSGTATLSFSSTAIWTGYNSTNWNDATNWCNDAIPTASSSVIVPAGTINSPQLTANGAVGSLQLDAGATINLNGFNFAINGAVSGSGSFIGSYTSSLTAATGASGTIYFTPDSTSPFSDNYLKTLTVNSGATITLGDTLKITGGTSGYGTNSGSVAVTGSLTVDPSNGFLVLNSNAFGDAQVSASTGTITSNSRVQVERYIPAKRAWRFLTVPFSSSSQSINAAWQEGHTLSTMTCPTNDLATAGYGTEITISTSAGNGYDVNTTSNPSLKVWSNNAWSTLASTTGSNIATSGPYCIFVRGDRTICLLNGVSAGSNTTTLRAIGTLNETGATVTKNFSGVNNGDFIFVGNPFAAAVDFTKLTSTNFNTNSLYVWDPKLTGFNGVGAYNIYNTGTGWSVTSGSYSGEAPIIQSGQAFMVVATATSGSVGFGQTAKSSTLFSTERPSGGPVKPVLFAQLALPTDSMQIADGVAVGFGNQYPKGINAYYAPKNWNFGENMALKQDGKYFAVEDRPLPQLTDTLFFTLYLHQNEPYAIKLFSQALPGNVRAWLLDNYLKTKTNFNLGDTTIYNFTPNSDTNSYRNRFMVVLNHQFSGTPVPVTKAVNQANPNETGVSNSIVVRAAGVNLYPNPAGQGETKLQFNSMPAGNYEIAIFNASGQKLAEQTIQHSGGNNAYPLPLNASLVSSGIYNVRVVSDAWKTENLKLIVGK
jgi:hypothetical protein